MHTERSLKNKSALYISVLLIGLFFSVPQYAKAATLQISSGASEISVGDTLAVSVTLSSDVSINNAEATVIFPSELFDVISINKTGSIFSIWVEEPSANYPGIISFDGGVPTPGFVGNRGNVISFVVKAKKEGQGIFDFSNAAIRANDGLGTDVLSSKMGKTVTVSKKLPAVTKQPVKAASTPIPIKTTVQETQTSSIEIDITSSTHPNQDAWYNDRNPVFKWSVPDGVVSVQSIISKDPAAIPNVTDTGAVGEKAITKLSDGVWYFRARVKKGGVWGITDTYIVRVDTTSPVKNSADFLYDEKTKSLNIQADFQDVTSGIETYKVYINNAPPVDVPAKEFVNGSHSMTIEALEYNTVKLLAVDRAGNWAEALGSFNTKNKPILLLEPIPALVSVDEQVLVHGTTQSANTDVVIKIKHDTNEPTIIATRSNADRSFFVLTSKLKSGSYEIWAETGSDKTLVSSSHLFTKVTPQTLVTIGSLTMTEWSIIIPGLIGMIVLIGGAYYLGRRQRKSYNTIIR